MRVLLESGTGCTAPYTVSAVGTTVLCAAVRCVCTVCTRFFMKPLYAMNFNLYFE